MHMNPEEIDSEALQIDGKYECLWVKEAARRYQQLKDGTARSIPADEVFARLDARFQGGIEHDENR
jgi:Putative addiction module component